MRVEREPLLDEVGAEITVRGREAVPHELFRHPGGVVVRALDHGGILHEVDAEQEGVTGSERGSDCPEQRRASLWVEIADRAAEERDHAALTGWDRGEVAFEVADDAMHRDRRIALRDRLRAEPENVVTHVERHEPLERARGRQCVE